jgi:hypothetical protein
MVAYYTSTQPLQTNKVSSMSQMLPYYFNQENDVSQQSMLIAVNLIDFYHCIHIKSQKTTTKNSLLLLVTHTRHELPPTGTDRLNKNSTHQNHKWQVNPKSHLHMHVVLLIGSNFLCLIRYISSSNIQLASPLSKQRSGLAIVVKGRA